MWEKFKRLTQTEEFILGFPLAFFVLFTFFVSTWIVIPLAIWVLTIINNINGKGWGLY